MDPLIYWLLALFPIVENIQTNLFDGGECGEEVFNSTLNIPAITHFLL